MRIIKTDHISYINSRIERDETIKYLGKSGYKLKWEECNKPNITAKSKFFQAPHLNHDILFLQKDTNHLPIEVILYDQVYGESYVKYKNNQLLGVCCDSKMNKTIFNELGGVKLYHNDTEKIIGIKGILDKYETRITIEQNEKPDKPFLDAKGFGCLALVCDSLKNLNLMQNAKSTIPESFNVHGRELEICFLSIERVNFLIELICPIKGRVGNKEIAVRGNSNI